MSTTTQAIEALEKCKASFELMNGFAGEIRICNEALAALRSPEQVGQEVVNRAMEHIKTAVCEYDPFPEQVDETGFLNNIRENLEIEFGAKPNTDQG